MPAPALKHAVRLFGCVLQARSKKLLCLSCWETLKQALCIPFTTWQTKYTKPAVGKAGGCNCWAAGAFCWLPAEQWCPAQGQAVGLLPGCTRGISGRCCMGSKAVSLPVCALYLNTNCCLVTGFASAQTRMPGGTLPFAVVRWVRCCTEVTLL